MGSNLPEFIDFAASPITSWKASPSASDCRERCLEGRSRCPSSCSSFPSSCSLVSLPRSALLRLRCERRFRLDCYAGLCASAFDDSLGSLSCLSSESKSTLTKFDESTLDYCLWAPPALLIDIALFIFTVISVVYFVINCIQHYASAT